jgi:hypothetical protein
MWSGMILSLLVGDDTSQNSNGFAKNPRAIITPSALVSWRTFRASSTLLMDPLMMI